MKILVLAHSYPDEAGRHIGGIFVREQAEALVRRGIQVTVVSPLPAGWSRRRRTSFADYRQQGVDVRFARFLVDPTAFFVGRGRWVRRSVKAVLAALGGTNVDLVHAHTMWPAGSVGVAVGRALGVPVVVTEHRNHAGARLGSRRQAFLRRNYSLADLVICVNPYDAERLRQAVPKAKVAVLPNGFDPAKLRSPATPPPSWLPNTKGIRLFALGNLVKAKGHDLLIEAVRLLATDGLRATCVIGGPGPGRRRLERLAAKAGLEGHVRFVGRLDGATAAAAFEWCHMFVLPSRWESYGIVQLEALACGKPVVATPTDGSRSLFAEAPKCGVLAEAISPEAIAKAIRQAHGMAWDSESLVRSARRMTWDVRCARLSELYQTVMSKKPT